MTHHDFITIRPGFRVSDGATLGFISRCGNHTARRFRKLFKSRPAHDSALPAKVGGVGASGNVSNVSHASIMSAGTNDDEQAEI